MAKKADKNTGIKPDQGKLRFDLLPINALEEVLGVINWGANNRGDHNWRRVKNGKTRYWNALMRHSLAFRKGELKDKETGYHPLAHLIVDAIFLLAKQLEANRKPHPQKGSIRCKK